MSGHKSAIRFLPYAIIFVYSILCGCGRQPRNNTGQQLASNSSIPNISVSIPFELSRNKIILPVRIDDSRKLKVILDTGMPFDGLLLFNADLSESLNLRNVIDVEVPGAGEGSAASAIMAESMSFSVGDVEFSNQKIIVLKNDIMRDFQSDGVTGHSLLGNYVVEIDYDRMLVLLHKTSDQLLDPSWVGIPLTFRNNRQIPWIDAVICIKDDERIPVSLYIDLASSDALELLTRDGMKFDMPDRLEDSYLGRGLSGDIYGKKGKIVSLTLGSYELEDVVTAFAPAHIRSKQEGADGIIGNDVLRRFNVIFDYGKLRLYMRPNSYFSKPFQQ